MNRLEKIKLKIKPEHTIGMNIYTGFWYLPVDITSINRQTGEIEIQVKKDIQLFHNDSFSIDASE